MWQSPAQAWFWLAGRNNVAGPSQPGSSDRLIAGVRQLNNLLVWTQMGDSDFQVLWQDRDRVFCRGWRLGADGNLGAVLAVLPATEHPPPTSLARLVHEYGLKNELDGAWAVMPLELLRERGRTILLLEDRGGQPLEHLLGPPKEMGTVLRLAV